MTEPSPRSPEPTTADLDARRAARRYPDRPIVAVLAVVLRGDGSETRALIVQRAQQPNAGRWGFPGGVLELGETVAAGAMRELFEETGIWLGRTLRDAAEKRRKLLARQVRFGDLFAEAPIDIERLVWTARWITPVGTPKRFDTYFFLACVGRNVVATAEQNEAVEVTWISPARAVERHMTGNFPLVFPTLKNLQAIVGFASSADLLDVRRKAEIATTRPILVVENGQKKILLP